MRIGLVITLASSMLLVTAEARAQSDDEVVTIVDDSAPAKSTTSAAPAPAPAPASDDRFELRGFTRATVAVGLGASDAPRGAPWAERVGYERAQAVHQSFLSVRYLRGSSFQTFVSGSLAYGARLDEGGAAQGGAGRELRAKNVEPILREAYVGWFGQNVDVRFGQQRIAWGNSEAFTPNDVLNARDLRERLVFDPELVNLPTPAARLDWEIGSLTLGVVAQPFFVPDRVSLYGDNWSLVQPGAPRAHRRVFGLTAGDEDRTPIVDTRPPKSIADGGSIGTSLKFHSPKVDASFYWHWGLDRSPFVYLDPALEARMESADQAGLAAIAFEAAQRRGAFVVQYYRRHHVGFDASTSAGPFVLRADAAFDSAATYFARDTLQSIAKPSAQAVVGIERITGNTKKAIAIEAWYMRLFGPEVPIVPALDQGNKGPLLFVENDNVSIAALVRWPIFDEIVFETRALLGVRPLSYTVRPEIGWETSNFTLRLGALVLDGETGSAGGWYGRNDTAYVTARYTF